MLRVWVKSEKVGLNCVLEMNTGIMKSVLFYFVWFDLHPRILRFLFFLFFLFFSIFLVFFGIFEYKKQIAMLPNHTFGLSPPF